jgi:elongation factor Ts
MPELMELVKLLRDETGLSLLDCKAAATHALEQGANADTKTLIGKGVDYLRGKGKDKAMKKGSRATAEGYIGSYVHHNGKIAVLVEVNCESDFVAKNENFQKFLKDFALHIAGAAPVAVSSDNVPQDIIDKEKVIYKQQLIEEGKKPPAMHDKIIEGKLQAYFKENCLLNQPFMPDTEGRTVQQHLESLISKSGENIVIRRFTRWVLGKD